jgi:hypothetical protein
MSLSTQTNRRLRVFVSSTFRDKMMVEQNELTSNTCPELHQRTPDSLYARYLPREVLLEIAGHLGLAELLLGDLAAECHERFDRLGCGLTV